MIETPKNLVLMQQMKDNAMYNEKVNRGIAPQVRIQKPLSFTDKAGIYRDYKKQYPIIGGNGQPNMEYEDDANNLGKLMYGGAYGEDELQRVSFFPNFIQDESKQFHKPENVQKREAVRKSHLLLNKPRTMIMKSEMKEPLKGAGRSEQDIQDAKLRMDTKTMNKGKDYQLQTNLGFPLVASGKTSWHDRVKAYMVANKCSMIEASKALGKKK